MSTRALIYVRRSTSEHQAASLEVQEAEARRFCAAKGWDVVDVLAEDGVSRAEFVNRPALGRLLVMAAAQPRAFDAVVTRDESRVGGDLWRTGMVLQDLADVGVAVWYYATGERVSFDDPTGKFMAAARLYAAELERLKITGRTREALAHRHREGFNVGGKVYGYRNVRVGDRTAYEVDPGEARVVAEIFERFASGEGVRGIAKALNARGVPSPRHGTRGTGSWCPSAVHAMVRSERYRGVLAWGKTGAEYRGGTRKGVRRGEGEVLRVERPELAIVSAGLWERAQTRTRRRGAPHTGKAPGYLLSGIGRCSSCGGPIHATNSKRGRQIIKVYHCGWNRSRGPEVCPVNVRRPVEDIDRLVVGWIRLNVMKPEVVEAVVAAVRARVESAREPRPSGELAEARAALARVEGEVRRLTAALASSDEAPAAVVAAIADRERQLAGLRASVSRLEAAPDAEAPSWGDWEAEVRAEVADVAGLLSGPLAGAREALRRLLKGALLFAPSGPAEGPRAWEVTADVVFPAGAVLSTSRQGYLILHLRA